MQAEVQTACNRGEVPCGALMSIEDISKDPHYAARKTLTEMMVEGIGPLPFPSPLPRLSENDLIKHKKMVSFSPSLFLKYLRRRHRISSKSTFF